MVRQPAFTVFTIQKPILIGAIAGKFFKVSVVICLEEFGGSGGIRTLDQWLKRPLLYR